MEFLAHFILIPGQTLTWSQVEAINVTIAPMMPIPIRQLTDDVPTIGLTQMTDSGAQHEYERRLELGRRF
jgi:hypothetical protein